MASDDAPAGTKDQQREARSLKRLQKDAKNLRDWLEKHPEDRKGASGKTVLSNLTDNESAKMATGKGVIQPDPEMVKAYHAEGGYLDQLEVAFEKLRKS